MIAGQCAVTSLYNQPDVCTRRESLGEMRFSVFNFFFAALQKNPSSEAQKHKTLWGALGFIVE